ncbi:MAG: hypothetical protein CMN32_09260 [Saprospirales bacterium]|nr:hypothetical protein [Saprospirales bacterium]
MKTTVLAAITLFLTAFSLSLPQQLHKLSGTVYDESGNPLIAVNVVVKGTSIGAVTNFDGTFELVVAQPCATLEFSYVGFKTKEVSNVCEGTPVSVTLEASTEALSEVVVTSRKALMKKNEITTAMAILPAGCAADRMSAPSGNAYYLETEPNWNTEDYDHIVENRFLAVRDNPLSTFSIDVDAASYSNIRRFIKNGQLPPADAVRIEEMVNYFDYEYPQPEADSEMPFTVSTELNDCPWNPEHKLMLIGLQGKVLTPENLPPANLVFLLDVSGSMQAPNKLPLVKSSLKLLVNQLRPQDRVAIAVYAGAAGLVLPSTPGNDRQKIFSAIEALEAGGSTAGAAGIKLAYQTARENFAEGGNNRVILCTDGDFNVGVSSDGELVRLIEKERESGIFLTVLGYGMGNYKDNKMQKLADSGNGNHYYIDDISESKKVLVEEFGGTMYTIAKDVKLQLEFNPAKVQGYRLIGYENRMLRSEDFKDDKKDAGEMGSGHRVTALYEIIPAGVKTDLLADIDELKYQKTKTVKGAKGSDELLTVKVRWKAPDGKKSQQRDFPVLDAQGKMSSDNFRFAAAVAEFGMLLRDSEFKGSASYKKAAELARSAVGKDPNGYRNELVRMIETVDALTSPVAAEK